MKVTNMQIIAVDDEKIALDGMMKTIRSVLPDDVVTGFQSSAEALEYARSHRCQIAFVDIEMPQMDGVTLAKRLKICTPDINIVFTTGYSEYAADAFALHASGYIMKPVTEGKIRKEVEDLRHPVVKEQEKKLRAMTFGNFEVFIDEKPVKFQYSKTKELLAYLIDRNGAMCTNGELIGVLWEDDAHAGSRISYLKNLRSDLLSVLKKGGCEDVLVRKRGEIAIVPEKIQCDYYEWLKGNVSGINAYRGEYMEQYTWGELTHGELES